MLIMYGMQKCMRRKARTGNPNNAQTQSIYTLTKLHKFSILFIITNLYGSKVKLCYLKELQNLLGIIRLWRGRSWHFMKVHYTSVDVESWLNLHVPKPVYLPFACCLLTRSIRDSGTSIDFVQGPPGSRRERVKIFFFRNPFSPSTQNILFK